MRKPVAAIVVLTIVFFMSGLVSAARVVRGPSTAGRQCFVKYHRHPNKNLAPMDSATLRAGMMVEEDGELPDKDIELLKLAQNPSLQEKRRALESRLAGFALETVLVPKVPTRILQSVLIL